MEMNSYMIENFATDAVKNYCLHTSKIKSYIANEDKEPGYDGHLKIYDSISQTKDDYLGNIPVQIKGKKAKKKHPSLFKQNKVNKRDLEMYLKDGGCYYFVVLINENGESQVYGRQLLPMYLKYKLKSKSKSVTIEMYEITSYKDFYDNCIQYLKQSKKQANPIEFSINKKRNQKMTITSPENIVTDKNGFPLNDFYSFIHINDSDIKVTVPDQILRPEKFSKLQKGSIYSEGKVIYEGNIRFDVTSTYTSIIIDESFYLTKYNESKKAKYSLLPIKNIDRYLEILNLVKALSNGGEFIFEDVQVILDKFKLDKSVDRITSILTQFKQVTAETDNLIKKSTIINDDNIEKQLSEMVGIIKIIKNKEFNAYNMKKDKFYKILFGNNNFILWKYNNVIYNVFSDNFLKRVELVVDNETMLAIYSFNTSFMINTINFDFQLIEKYLKIEDFSNISIQKWNYINNFCLELIKSYDITKELGFLNIAEFILSNIDIKDIDSTFITKINLAQVKIRKDERLESDLKKLLVELKSKLESISSDDASLHLSIIFGSKTEAMIYFENLSEEELGVFKNYPIYYLYQKLL
ncbi:hypothetical protein [Mammaliicoccus sciuri]|uniref:hypothetical protein n=1 Tax=Mammaliicoccus sciuri TaxID=1296 RepID=UPI001330A380|nr:hypothetical protein [Mammaliicoccus sciuri]